MLSSQKLFEEAFKGPRDPRSDEYRCGVLAALRFRCEGLRIGLPYRVGTAQADAFFSGVDEGHRLWRDSLEEDNV